MSMYGSSNGMQEPLVPKASQACMSCRKQKRKCNKALPACGLCERMNRHCDYSDASPPPTSEDFNALRMKLMELESRLTGGNSLVSPAASFPTPSTTLSTSESLGLPLPPYHQTPQDYSWQGVQNKFPAIAVLDSDTFKNGGMIVPRPNIEMPVDVLEHLGDGTNIQAIANEYFITIHRWMPIISQKRLMVNMNSPLWEAGPDLALLFLSMKLIISRPLDIESAHTPLYTSAKRFITLMEVSGTISLFVLQAGLLITWYEYGQAVYPAAYMSAGWCLRYANLLGVSDHSESLQLLGKLATWTEQEERRRAWWGVLIMDRIVSSGSQGYILNSQEAKDEDALPTNDSAWDQGDMSLARHKLVSNPVSEPIDPFPRLCQAYVFLGKVLSHHHGEELPSKTAKFGVANQLYIDISALARKLKEETDSTHDYLSFTPALSLTYSTLCALCEEYSCVDKIDARDTETTEMQTKAIDGLKTVAGSVVEFAERINTATQDPRDLDRLSPIVMDSIYTAAANFAWLVRETGDENYQMALDSLRHCLRKFLTRWRNAGEYLRILEAQEFTYAVGSAAT